MLLFDLKLGKLVRTWSCDQVVTWSEPGLEKFCPGLTWPVCINGTALPLLTFESKSLGSFLISGNMFTIC